MKSPSILLRALRAPAMLASLELAEWDLLVRQARKANLLASLHAMLDSRGMLDQVPAPARRHLEWSASIAQRHMQAVAREVALIGRALASTGVPLILLKGAAYAMAALPASRGRLFSDIDILVPKPQLDAVEAALMLHGWAGVEHDAYDQRYYRQWMHELPPMQHIRRMTTIDVHHAIVPKTASIHPDPDKLRSAALAVPACPGLKTLAPIDMVLHSAVHLFHDGEFDNGLRDLVDLHILLQHFASLPGFWPDLITRGRELELARPLFYALRYAACLLHTPIPPEAVQAADAARPPRPQLWLMDQLLLRALLPAHASCDDGWTAITRKLLYVRANWLRMPPLLLARHLFHKAFLSPKIE